MKRLVILITSAVLTHSHAAEIIPGLEPVDVYLNLEKKGFTTTKHFGQSQNTFVCELEEDDCSYTVTAYTPAGSASTVKTVQVMAQWFGPGDDAATEKLKPFMSFAATFPYEGATPEQAKRWVEANLGKEVSATFAAGVKFELFSKARTRLLRISMAPTKAPSSAASASANASPAAVPSNGQTFEEVTSQFGPPTIKEPDTGRATWKTFKVQFKDGKAVQIDPR